MTSSVEKGESQPWTHERWLVVIGAIFLAQVGTIYGFMREPSAPVTRVTSPNRARIDLGSDLMSEIHDSPFWLNPLGFAGEDERGFSGLSVQLLPRPEYVLDQASVNPRWLRSREGAAGHAEIERTPQPRKRVEEDVLARLGLPATAPGVLKRASFVAIEGDLAKRSWLRPLTPATRPGSEPLPLTVIEVGVAPDGDVFSALLIGSSGDPETDNEALRLARSARFQPLGPPRSPRGTEDDPPLKLTWGRLVFHWWVN
jgi:TonB family protein